MVIAACTHPKVFWDTDEERCRTCGASVSFPRHDPTAEESRRRNSERRIEGRQRAAAPKPIKLPETSCLECTCCKLTLPTSEFSTNTKAKNRGQLSYQCRPCMAFRSRLARTLAPEETRRKGRERATTYYASRSPEQREAATLRRAGAKTSINAATRRYRARAAGRSVPIQRRGKPVLLVKAICRIRDSCPLASYCVDKAPSDKPQPLARASKGLD